MNQRFKIAAQNERMISLLFQKQVAQVLELEPTLVENPIGNDVNVFKFKAKLNLNMSNFYVYSDITSFIFISDTVAPILRIVSFQSKQDSNFLYKEFKLCTLFLLQNLL